MNKKQPTSQVVIWGIEERNKRGGEMKRSESKRSKEKKERMALKEKKR